MFFPKLSRMIEVEKFLRVQGKNYRPFLEYLFRTSEEMEKINPGTFVKKIEIITEQTTAESLSFIKSLFDLKAILWSKEKDTVIFAPIFRWYLKVLWYEESCKIEQEKRTMK